MSVQLLARALCLLTPLAPAADPFPPDPAVDALFAAFDRPDTPGCAVAVIDGGEVIYARGYGSAQLEYQVPITPDTPFHVASVSKQFAAFAVILLATRGELSLDDEVRRHIPELPDFGAPLTLRHLIHHTSGLRDQWSLLTLAGWRMDDVIDHGDVMRLVTSQRELNFPPGERHLYCNTGYTLLAEVVDRVTGKSLRDFAAQEIFGPLGMEHTHFHDDHQHLVPGRAYSYRPAPAGGWENAVLSYAVVGATSLFTTVMDLARWQENFELMGVGGEEAIARMLEPGVLNDGTTLSYAGGLVHGRYRGLPIVQHSGGDAGFRSYLVRFPQQGLSVAVLSNAAPADTAQLAHQVAELYLGDALQEAAATPQTLAQMLGAAGPPAGLPGEETAAALDLGPLLGCYYSPELDTTYRLLRQGDAVLLRRRHYPDEPLVAQGGATFAADLGELRFEPGCAEQPAQFFVSTGRVLNLRFRRLAQDPQEP